MCDKSYLRYDKICSYCDNAEAREAQRMEKEKEETAEAANAAGKTDKKMHVFLFLSACKMATSLQGASV